MTKCTSASHVQDGFCAVQHEAVRSIESMVVTASQEYLLRVLTNDFAPRLKAGEYVWCDSGRNVKSGDEVRVGLCSGEEPKLMVLIDVQDGQYTFESVNGGPRKVVPQSDVRSMHVMIGCLSARATVARRLASCPAKLRE